MKVLQRVLSVLCIVVLSSTSMPTIATASESDYASIDTIVELMNLLMESEEYQYNLSGSTDGFILKLGASNVSAAIRLYLSLELKPGKEEMDTVKETMQSLGSSVQELVPTWCGIQNPNILVLFTDDQDQSIIYFAMFNGEIIYDVFNAD